MDSKLSNSLATFAVNFCNELGTKKTTVCSPLSAELLLAVLALGSRGQSRAELLEALDIPDDEALRSSFAYLTTTLQSIEGATLNLANKVYLKRSSDVKTEIKKDVQEVFGSSLEQLDFNEGKAAAGLINKWVSEKTGGMVTDIVSAQQFNEETRLVLVNAIYFQGNWNWPFRKRRTKLREFHVNNTTKIEVPQMSKTGFYFFYGAFPELKAKILDMPYQGGEASMVIILPDEIEGLSYIMDKLNAGHDLIADIKELRHTKVDIRIPKFKAEVTINLKTLLPKLGITSIFDEKRSDIDMLTSSESLFVSDAVQKACIIVNESGTKAAAATICNYVRFQRLTSPRPSQWKSTASHDGLPIRPADR